MGINQAECVQFARGVAFNTAGTILPQAHLELLPRFWSGERLVAFVSALREYLGKIPDRAAAARFAREMHRAVVDDAVEHETVNGDHDNVCRWGDVMSATPPPWATAQRSDHSHRKDFELWNGRQAAAFGLLKHVRFCASHKVKGFDDEQIGANARGPGACYLAPL